MVGLLASQPNGNNVGFSYVVFHPLWRPFCITCPPNWVVPIKVFGMYVSIKVHLVLSMC